MGIHASKMIYTLSEKKVPMPMPDRSFRHDTVFLFIGSHYSDQAWWVVDQWPFTLNTFIQAVGCVSQTMS